MYRKIFTGVAGAVMMSLALSGCNSNAVEASLAVSVPEVTFPADAEQGLTGTESNNDTPLIANDPIVDEPSGSEEGNSANEMPGADTNTSPSYEDIEHLLPEGMEIPEGLVLSLPPTMTRAGLEDGADVPLVVMGEKLSFEGQGPVMLDGEVFVPVVGIFDNVNPIYPFITAWDGDTVTIRNPHVTVTITEVPGQDSTFEHRITRPFPGFMPVVPRIPAQRINGEFMLPLQPIAEAIGIEFEWVEERDEVHLFIILEGFGIAVSSNDGTVISFRPPNPFVY